MITTILIGSLIVNIALVLAVCSMSTSRLGVFSQTATRSYLKLLSVFRVPVSIVAYDIRKMHELNAVLGYSNSNILIARLTKIRRRKVDFIGQYGGDEFVVVSRPGVGSLIAKRIMDRAQEMSLEISQEQRDSLKQRTCGLMDGLYVSIAFTDVTRDALGTASLLVDETERLKEQGALMTGSRATSGNVGTLCSEL